MGSSHLPCWATKHLNILALANKDSLFWQGPWTTEICIPGASISDGVTLVKSLYVSASMCWPLWARDKPPDFWGPDKEPPRQARANSWEWFAVDPLIPRTYQTLSLLINVDTIASSKALNIQHHWQIPLCCPTWPSSTISYWHEGSETEELNCFFF